MVLNLIKNTVLLFVSVQLIFSIINNSIYPSTKPSKINNTKKISVGANQLDLYLPYLKNKSIGVVANQTSVIFKNNSEGKYTHLVDSLVDLGINIKKVFAPEHGYRGLADAGEYVKDGFDVKTGLPIVSLYGENRKPNPEILKDIDLIIFDIQGVGARFYTFVSTLHYMMETCAAMNIPILILDRPNPNAHYVDGPVLDMKYKSFVGMHPVPIAHGMTLGEFALMINGEGWLEKNLKCDITIVQILNYDRKLIYELPINPSPNLPNKKAVNLYPSLCLFEGTNVSIGRGTSMQFQIYGSPYLNKKDSQFKFTPIPNLGAKKPKHQGNICYGKNLQNSIFLNQINLRWIIDAYKETENKSDFFNPFFNKLAGQETLKEQIKNGVSIKKIKKSWEPELKIFKSIRSNYLIYD